MANTKREQILADYKSSFVHESGRRVLDDLKRFCGYEKALFSKGSTSSVNEMLVAEGKRIVYLHIQKMLKNQTQLSAKAREAGGK